LSDPAVVLLSGGLDSAVAGAWARDRGYSLLSLSVDYGQRARAELDAARDLSGWLGASEHVFLDVNLRAVGGSALTGALEIPRGEGGKAIPVTYVPARNTLLLALALGLAEAREAEAIVIGVNRIDFSGYPDCRPEFLEAFEALAAVGTRVGVEGRPPRILAPLLDLSKADIIAMGHELEVPFERTLSCYDPGRDGDACGECESCLLRRRGFEQAGVEDPTRYR
jgi:7-cyano-7-deazaguanine synthase